MKKDIKEYLTDTIYTANNLGADIYVQEGGDLLLKRNGKYQALDFLPRIKHNKSSDTLYLNVGNQKLQVYHNIDIRSGKHSIDTQLKTSISSINNFANSKIVQNTAELKGADEGFDKFLGLLLNDKSKIAQGSTINGFGGSDMDSNHKVDVSDIKNVLFDLFGVGDKNSSALNDLELLDKTLKTDFKQRLQDLYNRQPDINKGKIEELDPTL